MLRTSTTTPSPLQASRPGVHPRAARTTALQRAVLALLGCASVGSAWAQATPAAEPAAAAQPAVQQVTISASRIDRLGFIAPTPTTVLGAATLESRATVNVGDVLNEIPAFRGSVNPGAGGLGNSGQFLADLRGLGAQRTLVLLDRKRLPATNIPGLAQFTGATNLSIIPTALIRSVDVVTGGASAAYGSDAVAGVVNIVLDDKLQGIKGSVQYGATRYDDARDAFASLAGGTSFAEGRGHIVIGGEYNSNSGTGAFNDKRDWGRQGWGLIQNIPSTRPAGVAANFIGPNTGVYFRQASSGGVIQNPGPLNLLAFVPGPNGTVTTARMATGRFGVGNGESFTEEALAANRAAGIDNLNLQQLRPELERANLMARLTYQLTDDISAHIEPLFSHVQNTALLIVRRDGAGAGPALRIQNDNPYLQQALTPAQLALVPGYAPGSNTQQAGGLAIGYLGNDWDPIQNRNTHRTTRLAAGLKGTIGESWSWDLGLVSGKNVADRVHRNNFNNANFRNAVDAITLNGAIVCRSAAARAQGCQPINILGQLNASDAARAYVLGEASGTATSKVESVSANLQGEPFTLPAGPVSLGMGLEHRKESLAIDTDAISRANGWLAGVGAGLPEAKLTVQEAYVETIVPLLKKASFAKALDFNGAVRYTDYSTSGQVETWKGGISWEVSDQLRLRATRSRDIRAPSLMDLFAPITTVAPVPVDPRTALSGVPAPTALPTTGGNPNLQPERADTETIGIVFQPKAVRRLSLSADYYNINVKDAITSTSAQAAVNQCLQGGVFTGSPLCSLITFANNDVVNGQILAVSAQQANVGSFRTRGLDIQASYTMALKDFSEALAGQLDLRLLGTRVFEFRTSADISALFPNGINRAGQTGAAFGGPAGLPSMSWTASADYRLDKLSVNAQLRHISKSRQDNGLVGPDSAAYASTLVNSVNDNIVPRYVLVNLGASYNFGTREQRRELYVNVNNVFDRDPPLPANGSAYYDLMGRAFRIGARVSF